MFNLMNANTSINRQVKVYWQSLTNSVPLRARNLLIIALRLLSIVMIYVNLIGPMVMWYLPIVHGNNPPLSVDH
jgi:uncharacterized Tic20 family protein